jgi:hypothetical protein
MKGNSGSQVAEKVANLPWPWPMPGANDLLDYWVDAWQRSILLLDVLRQRGDNSIEHNARTAPNVLSFEAELVLDGRSLPRPVNYALVRIIPPEGASVDPGKRPFIVFDPRAGHGPGIGGMKHDSEIGVALAAGHPCYFAGFLPDPVPGQTIEQRTDERSAGLLRRTKNDCCCRVNWIPQPLPAPHLLSRNSAARL